MIIINNKLIPFGKKFLAINLFGILFTKGECSEQVLRHEKIHTAQMRELLYIPFYIIYMAEWLYHLFKVRNALKAYHRISFEREAYQNQNNPDYLLTRKRYASFRNTQAN